MRGKLLVDARNFMNALEQDMLYAKDIIAVQVMTFEGDQAGKLLIDAMLKSKAERKILLIDAYTRAVINDHFVIGIEYLRSASFRNEVRQTEALIRKAKASGIEVKITNPLGIFMYKYPLRNHKKMIIIDAKISYLGGINFSDHNFAWHDAMIRLEDEEVGKCLMGDIYSSMDGFNQSRKVELKDHDLYFLNGAKSRELYHDLFSILAKSKNSIDIISPYISDPLLSFIRENVHENVNVRIISPFENNKSIFKKYLNNELAKGYFDLYHYNEGMSHLKAILVDNETLIMGSSNFDVISYYFEQEVLLVSKDQALIQEFKEHVLKVDLQASMRVERDEKNQTSISTLLIKLLNSASEIASTTFLKPK
ncbi:MAG: phosphatidylserine/phosphatidylglycerophosphate/cardiolipin synthase family protein [Bacteroidota bacterium]